MVVRLLGRTKMNSWMNIKKFIAVTTFCGYLFMSHSAYAFVWPTIDLSMVINFIITVNTKISIITQKIAEGQGKIQQENTLGKNIGDMAKNANMLSSSFNTIKSSIEVSIQSTKDAANAVKETHDQAQQAINDGQNKDKEIANDTVDSVNNQVNDGATEEEVNQTINDAKEESEKNRQEVNDKLDNASQKIASTLDEASNKLNEMMENLPTDVLTEEQRQSYKEEADAISKKIDSLKSNSQSIIEKAKNNYNEQYSTFVSSAFDEYSQAVNDYYSGKISKEELAQAGEKLKNSVSSFDAGIDMSEIDALVSEAESIISDIDALGNRIINDASNYKEYDDSHLLKKEETTFAFNYTDLKQNMHTTVVMLDEAENEADRRMLLPSELFCKDFKIEELETKEQVQNEFRVCVTMAKTEIDFWEELGIGGDPYDMPIYKPFKKNGVYKHIEEDYSTANLANVTQEKQFVNSWLGRIEGEDGVGKEEINENSAFAIWSNEIDGIADEKHGYTMWGIVNIELAKLLSNLRRIDALDRAKKIAKQFSVYNNLFLDQRDDDFVAAHNNGLGKIRDKTRGENPKDYVAQVFPNMMLQLCSQYVEGMVASEVSLSEDKKYDKDAKSKAEEKISKCMFVFAEAVSRGTINNKMIIPGDTEQGIIKWRENQTKTTTDAGFETLLLAVINNYNSSADYMENGSGDTPDTMSIPSIQKPFREEISDFHTAKSENAKVNFYTTLQLLAITDADAQALQTEILLDLPKYDYNYFDKQVIK